MAEQRLCDGGATSGAATAQRSQAEQGNGEVPLGYVEHSKGRVRPGSAMAKPRDAPLCKGRAECGAAKAELGQATRREGIAK